MTATRVIVLAIALSLAACGANLGPAQKSVRAAVDAQQDSLNACYAKTVARDADAKGMMQLVLHVTGGKIDSVDVTDTEIDDAKLAKCVKAALVAAEPDPPPAASFDVQYKLRFGAADDADGSDASDGSDGSDDADPPNKKPAAKKPAAKKPPPKPAADPDSSDGSDGSDDS